MVDYIRILGWVILTALAIKTVYGIGRFFYSLYFGAMLGHNTDPRNYGPWAGEFFFFKHQVFREQLISFNCNSPFYLTVVTGATDGIGKAYARKVCAFVLNETKK